MSLFVADPLFIGFLAVSALLIIGISKISDIVSPIALSHFSKKDVRSLNKAQIDQLEHLKLCIFHFMTFIIYKYLITAFIIVFVSEIAKRSDKLGALISSLPLVTILIMIWLYIENQSIEKIANHAYYTFWYVIPTLPMFLIIPYLL